jgi:hypothetical protein
MIKINPLILFLEAWVLLHWSRFRILFTPFQQIAGQLGDAQFETPEVEIAMDCLPQLRTAMRRAVKYALHNSNCFDQALTAMVLCRRRMIPATIYFGLSKDGGRLKAHAWLRCGHIFLTGSGMKKKYTAVAWFGKSYKPEIGI